MLVNFFILSIEFVTTLLLFYVVLVFGYKTCGILAPQPGIKLSLPALEGEVLTTGQSPCYPNGLSGRKGGTPE